ncbi:MAG: efflux RND transporter periplasmic adaptor subunit [Planctomycetaceae bacterium]|nr:efflux RND transporter periplasmic adaptor subunit [Planctomycetaceae bacterium]
MARTAFVRRVLRTGWKLALVVIVAAAIIYHVRFRPVPVKGFTVTSGDVQSEVMGTGSLDARTKITISSKITGRIASLGADQNDPVSKDQLLAMLDDTDLRQQVEMASASLAAAKASGIRADTDIVRAQAVLTQARLEHERSLQMYQKQAATRQEADKAKEALDVAQAGLDSAKAAKAESQQQTLTAEQTLKYQQARLAEARMVCPLDDGLVTFRYREVGDIVVPGTAIMDVVHLKEMWVSAWVDESASGALAIGQPARIVFRSQPDKPYFGEVARLAKQTDRETREFMVDVRVKELPPNWSVGQRAEVYITTGRKNDVPSIPQRLITWRDGKAGVFVDEGGKARYQEVGLGLTGRDTVEVARGLKIGQAVVTAADGDNSKLTDGRAIRR